MSKGRLCISGITFALLTMGCGLAHAQWSSQVTGPDVFGNTTVLATVDNADGNGLVVQCDQNNTLDLAYIIPGTPSELDELSKAGTSIPADLLVKVDHGQVMKFSAEFKAWNNTYIGIVASGRTTDIVAAIKAMGAAASQISVGAVIAGTQQSDSFDVENSTSTMNTATLDCKLSNIETGHSSDTATAQ